MLARLHGRVDRADGVDAVVGDRTELQSMERVFGDLGIAPGACVLGSIKSSIGHSKAAAGVASIIKVALCLHHRVLPPTLNLQRPNPYWNPETSPFSVRDRPHPAHVVETPFVPHRYVR